MSGAKFIQCLARFSKRYGFNFGFKEIDNDVEKLSSFLKVLTGTTVVEEVISYYNVSIYFLVLALYPDL